MERVSDMSYLSSKGLPTYSDLGFGESLSKVARHELAILCIQAIRDELNQNSIKSKGRGRGRPSSPASILAQRMEVHPDSVRRWTDIRQVQASDYNSEKLALMAFKYSPQRVGKLLQEDITRRQVTMALWLKEAEANNPVSPCVENTEVKEGA